MWKLQYKLVPTQICLIKKEFISSPKEKILGFQFWLSTGAQVILGPGFPLCLSPPPLFILYISIYHLSFWMGAIPKQTGLHVNKIVDAAADLPSA